VLIEWSEITHKQEKEEKMGLQLPDLHKARHGGLYRCKARLASTGASLGIDHRTWFDLVWPHSLSPCSPSQLPPPCPPSPTLSSDQCLSHYASPIIVKTRRASHQAIKPGLPKFDGQHTASHCSQPSLVGLVSGSPRHVGNT